MPNVNVVDLGGKSLGTLELPDEVFGPEQVNEALLWEAVKHYRASQRQGTAATKNRKLVSGAGKKLWKQKGTGRARVGSIRSPLWRHGGTVHGPQPRSYAYAFPRKKLQGALRAAIASKLVDGTLTVVDSLEIKEAKTKLYRQALNTLEATKTVLLVDAAASVSENLQRGARNLEGVDVMLTSDVHPYDLLRVEKAIFSRPALESLTETLKKSISKRKNAAAEKLGDEKAAKKPSKRKSQKEAA
jgi:large subunit ribosomal protein L4